MERRKGKGGGRRRKEGGGWREEKYQIYIRCNTAASLLPGSNTHSVFHCATIGIACDHTTPTSCIRCSSRCDTHTHAAVSSAQRIPRVTPQIVDHFPACDCSTSNTTLCNNSYDNNPLTHTRHGPGCVHCVPTQDTSLPPATEHVTSSRVNSPKMYTIRSPYNNSAELSTHTVHVHHTKHYQPGNNTKTAHTCVYSGTENNNVIQSPATEQVTQPRGLYS